MSALAGGLGVSTAPSPCQTSPTQVSWSLDHKSAHAGTYEVRFFDEESYSLLRKVRISHLEPRPGLQEGGQPPLPQPSPACSPCHRSSRPVGASLSQSRTGLGRDLPDHTPHLSLHLPCSSLAWFSSFHDSGQCSCVSNLSPPHLAAPLTPASSLQAQRNNEDISIIPPLFTVSVDHRVSGLKRLAQSREAGSTQQASHILFYFILF